MQAFLAINYSAKVGDNFAWGIGPVFAVQAFEANGVATFAPITKTYVSGLDPDTGVSSTPPTALSNNDHDISTGFGFAGGIWWGISDRFSMGLAYQSKMSMSEFDDYADLFAEQGDFDIPASIKLGFSVLASDTLRVNFDIENTAFGDVKSIANPMVNLFSCPIVPFGSEIENCLGGSNGGGFGWQDETIYKIGFEWQESETSTWRLGFSYGEQPIQTADVLFNILAPGVMERHITFGTTQKAANGGEWIFSFMYAPKKTITGPSAFDPGPDFASPQLIELSMSQVEFEIAYTF
jgi:long-chain fatty acid transport protein